MTRLGSVIGQFEGDLLTQFRHRLSFGQLLALSAMRDCRSPADPMMQVQSAGRDQQELVPYSCGHRFCPHVVFGPSRFEPPMLCSYCWRRDGDLQDADSLDIVRGRHAGRRGRHLTM